MDSRRNPRVLAQRTGKGSPIAQREREKSPGFFCSFVFLLDGGLKRGPQEPESARDVAARKELGKVT